MAAPTVLTPWKRDLLVVEGGHYRFGTWSLMDGVIMGDETIVIGDADPAVARARAAPEARGFLNWARFPFYRVEQQGGTTVVHIADARYTGDRGRGWASVEVRLP